VDPLTDAGAALAVRPAVVALRVAALPALALVRLALAVLAAPATRGATVVAAIFAATSPLVLIPTRSAVVTPLATIGGLIGVSWINRVHGIDRPGNAAPPSISTWCLALVDRTLEARAAVLIPLTGMPLDTTLRLLGTHLLLRSRIRDLGDGGKCRPAHEPENLTPVHETSYH
jgi:hypothetical protein